MFILAEGKFNYQIEIFKGKNFITNRKVKVPKLENESSKKGMITNFRRISIDCMAYKISLPNINLMSPLKHATISLLMKYVERNLEM